jgi:hypothetical protein
MAYHIKIGSMPWCKSPYSKRQDLSIVASDDGVILACSHVSSSTAHAMVEFLQTHGLDFARVVQGMCEVLNDPEEVKGGC